MKSELDKLTPKEARLILVDGGIQTLVQAIDESEEPETLFLKNLRSALVNLEKQLQQIAKRK